MQWLNQFQLFLFDFDGLLVNTEEIHFMAYQRMCKNRGFDLDWSFTRYCQSAHYESDALKKDIYATFPQLHAMEPSWDVLYAEKRKAVIDLLNEGAVHLMPGVEEMLAALDNAKIKRAVVTHSPEELVRVVRNKHPILNTIPHWITRQDYTHPKPHPECYIKAIEKLAASGEQVIGFEDTPRGIRALMGSKATPVLICTAEYPEISDFIKQGVKRYSSFMELLSPDFSLTMS